MMPTQKASICQRVAGLGEYLLAQEGCQPLLTLIYSRSSVPCQHLLSCAMDQEQHQLLMLCFHSTHYLELSSLSSSFKHCFNKSLQAHNMTLLSLALCQNAPSGGTETITTRKLQIKPDKELHQTSDNNHSSAMTRPQIISTTTSSTNTGK